jgi:signal transduction histidine kinase
VERRTAKIRAVTRDLASRVETTCADASEALRGLRASLLALLEGAGDVAASRVVMTQVARIESQIDKLAQLSNINVRSPERRNIDMQRLVQQVCSELTAALPERSISFDIDRLPCVVGDSILLRQIFVNLLANAIDATRDRPMARIRVWGDDDDGRAVWSIADNGVGFEMKDADAMFSSFARRGARAPGMGLGIAWHAVQQLGGRIWCEGQPGKGAVFHFTLGNEEERK